MLKAAAYQLRNPRTSPGLKFSVVPELVEPLARWLETEAANSADDEIHDSCLDMTCTFVAARAVARKILGTP